MTAADAGRMLEGLRHGTGTSRDLLADASGYTPGWLRQLEAGARTRASTLAAIVSTLARLAGLDVDATVAEVLDAADGDFKPEGPTPPRPTPTPDHLVAARAREAIRVRRAETVAELEAAGTDADALAKVADRLMRPPSPFEPAAKLLIDDHGGPE